MRRTSRSFGAGCWVLALVCAFSMATRGIASNLLAGTILGDSVVTEGLVGLLLGWMFFTGRLAEMSRSSTWAFEKFLLLYALALTVGLVFSIVFRPTFDYDSVFAIVLYRTYTISIVGGYVLGRHLVGSWRQIKPLLVILIVIAALIAAGFSVGGAYTASSDQARAAGMTAGGAFVLPLGFRVSTGGNTGAIYVMIFVFLGISLLFGGQSISWRLLGATVLVLGLMASAALATRAVLLALIPGMAAIYLLNARGRASALKRGAQMIGLAALLAVALWGVAFLIPQIERLPSYQRERLQVFSDHTGLLENESLHVRLDQYVAYLPTVLRYPLGYGLMDDYPQFTLRQPHSLHLRLLMTAGWLGWLCYLTFVVRMTLYMYRRKKDAGRASRPFLAAMVVTNLVLLALSWGYDFYNRFGIQLTYFLLCGFSAALAHAAHQRRIEDTGRRAPVGTGRGIRYPHVAGPSIPGHPRAATWKPRRGPTSTGERSVHSPEDPIEA